MIIASQLPSVFWEKTFGISRKIPRFLFPESLRIKIGIINKIMFRQIQNMIKRYHSATTNDKFWDLKNANWKESKSCKSYVKDNKNYFTIASTFKSVNGKKKSTDWATLTCWHLPSSTAAASTPGVSPPATSCVELSTTSPGLVAFVALLPPGKAHVPTAERITIFLLPNFQFYSLFLSFT